LALSRTSACKRCDPILKEMFVIFAVTYVHMYVMLLHMYVCNAVTYVHMYVCKAVTYVCEPIVSVIENKLLKTAIPKETGRFNT
jgi:hypothetical protein